MIPKKYLLVSVVVVLLVLSSACQASQDSPQDASANPLVGTWYQRSSLDDTYLQIKADGTFAIFLIYNDLEKFPMMSGTYSYQEDILTLEVAPEHSNRQECTGETAQFKVNFVQDDEFLLEDVAWECTMFNYLSSDNQSFIKYSETED